MSSTELSPGPATRELRIALGDRSYPIVIGRGLLARAATFEGLPRSSQALIVSNTTVAPIYAQALRAALAPLHGAVHLLELPDGEAYKDWATLNLIFDALLARGSDRKTVLYALGGGVVGDMTGFAAACYMRGVPFVQVPTTLLAQVDSSVGGKTAINHPQGKNMIGAFYQPQLVLADMDLLAWLEENMDALRARDVGALMHAVERSCAIKADVVGQDERESGLRAILNFGHTFGHAIEAGLGYGQWLHGEAVGCGMVMAARLSQRLGLVDEAFVQRLTRLIARAGLPVTAPVLDPQDNAGRYLALMRVDKKAEAGEVKFVVIEAPGRAGVRGASDAMVREVIDACCVLKCSGAHARAPASRAARAHAHRLPARP